MKKSILALSLMAALGLVLSGCAANANSLGTTMAPANTNTPMPATTTEPSASPEVGPSTSPTMMDMTPAEAGRIAEEIQTEVERISEIKEAQVLVRDERVLVAVKFEEQYQAGLDARMKQMIEQKVSEVDDRLKDVRITDDDTLYGQVKGMGERVAQVMGLDELADDFGDLWNRATGM